MNNETLESICDHTLAAAYNHARETGITVDKIKEFLRSESDEIPFAIPVGPRRIALITQVVCVYSYQEYLLFIEPWGPNGVFNDLSAKRCTSQSDKMWQQYLKLRRVLDDPDDGGRRMAA